MGAFPEIHACPRCGRLLFQSGEAIVEDQRLAVFRCDDCRVEVDGVDEKAEAALTFTLDENGLPFDNQSSEAWGAV